MTQVSGLNIKATDALPQDRVKVAHETPLTPRADQATLLCMRDIFFFAEAVSSDVSFVAPGGERS